MTSDRRMKTLEDGVDKIYMPLLKYHGACHVDISLHKFRSLSEAFI